MKLDGRMDYDGVAMIILKNPSANDLGVCDKFVDTVGGYSVPQPQIIENERIYEFAYKFGITFLILEIKFPRLPHWGMTVAYVKCVAACYHSFGPKVG